MTKHTILFLLLTITAQYCRPQSKFFIYFKDKGSGENVSLSKNSDAYQKALSLLSAKSIERRKKTLGTDNIITADDLPLSEDYIKKISSLGIKIENELKWFNAVSAYLTSGQIEQLKQFDFISRIEKVKTLTRVKDSEILSGIAKINSPKTIDPVYGQSYDQLNLIGIPEVHQKGITGSGVVIGLLDSGFDWKTPLALRDSKVKDEYDFVFKDNVTSNQANDRSDQQSHGTEVFSTIAAYKPGSMIGAAYNAEFYLAKTEYVPTETKTEEDNFAAGIEWLEAKGIDVATTSLGYNTFDNDNDSYTYSNMDGKTAICTKAYEKAFSLGIVTVSSAGNEGDGSWKYITSPADGYNVIAVGSVDNSNVLASSSSRGPTYDKRIKPEVTAQGVYVYVAVASSTNNYTYAMGTSFAAPLVCGTASLLLSAYPDLTNTQIRRIILATAANSASPNNDIGWGLVSAAKAIGFPNIESFNNGYRINKIFFNKNGIKKATVSVSDDGLSFKNYDMTLDNKIYYRYQLDSYSANKKIFFYFNYQDSLGSNNREPADSYYTVKYGATDVYLSSGSQSTDNLILSQNFPNPSSGKTSFSFVVLEEGHVSLKLFDILGREVKNLINTNLQKGSYIFTYNLKDLPSNIYIYQINLNNRLIAKKMILNK